MKTSEILTNLLSEFIIDEGKAEAGNYSAGTRARKTLQEMIKACKDGRTQIQAARTA